MTERIVRSPSTGASGADRRPLRRGGRGCRRPGGEGLRDDKSSDLPARRDPPERLRGAPREEEALARTIALEAGKPLKAARAEVERASGTFSAAAAAVETASGAHFPLDNEPGLPGEVGNPPARPARPRLRDHPFNFPLNLTSHKVAPPSGSARRSSRSPLADPPLAMALREIVLSAGWPEEAYAVLAVSGAAGETLVTDPRLPSSRSPARRVSAGGSARSPPEEGRPRVGRERGLIVHEDADLADRGGRPRAAASSTPASRASRSSGSSSTARSSTVRG